MSSYLTGRLSKNSHSPKQTSIFQPTLISGTLATAAIAAEEQQGKGEQVFDSPNHATSPSYSSGTSIREKTYGQRQRLSLRRSLSYSRPNNSSTNLFSDDNSDGTNDYYLEETSSKKDHTNFFPEIDPAKEQGSKSILEDIPFLDSYFKTYFPPKRGDDAVKSNEANSNENEEFYKKILSLMERASQRDGARDEAISDIKNALVEFKESLEMRTSKLGKMVNKILEQNDDEDREHVSIKTLEPSLHNLESVLLNKTNENGDISEKLDTINEVIEFVSSTQCKLVDLITERFQNSPVTPTKNPNLQYIKEDLSSLHKRIENGNENIQESVDFNTLELKKIAIKLDEMKERYTTQLKGEIHESKEDNHEKRTALLIENRLSHLMEAACSKPIEGLMTEIKSKIIQLTTPPTARNPYSMTTGIMSTTNLLDTGNRSSSALVLSMNEKLVSLTNLTEQAKDSTTGRLQSVEEKVKQIFQLQNEIVELIHPKALQQSKDDNKKIDNLDTFLSELKRISRENQSNQDVNLGWFVRMHDLVQNLSRTFCDDLSMTKINNIELRKSIGETLSKNSTIISNISKHVADNNNCLKIIMKKMNDDRDFLSHKLQKIEEKYVKQDNSALEQLSFVEKINLTLKNLSTDVNASSSATHSLLGRVSTIEGIIENFPLDTSNEFQRIQKAIDSLKQPPFLNQDRGSAIVSPTTPTFEEKALASLDAQNRKIESLEKTMTEILKTIQSTDTSAGRRTIQLANDRADLEKEQIKQNGPNPPKRGLTNFRCSSLESTLPETHQNNIARIRKEFEVSLRNPKALPQPR